MSTMNLLLGGLRIYGLWVGIPCFIIVFGMGLLSAMKDNKTTWIANVYVGLQYVAILCLCIASLWLLQYGIFHLINGGEWLFLIIIVCAGAIRVYDWHLKDAAKSKAIEAKSKRYLEEIRTH